MSISQSSLGRYEFISETSDSRKFWTVYLDTNTDTYTCEWGRIGRAAQGIKRGMRVGEAARKIREKVEKGYIRTGLGPFQLKAAQSAGSPAQPCEIKITPDTFIRKLNIPSRVNSKKKGRK